MPTHAFSASVCLLLLFVSAGTAQAQGSFGPVAITAGGGIFLSPSSTILASIGQPLAGEGKGLRVGLWYSIGTRGETIGTNVETAQPAVPDRYLLHQNYPNPFNPSTTIQYEIAEHGSVELVVMNMLGHRVATLHSGEQSAGVYNAIWDARDETGSAVASGFYMYRLSAPGFVKARKMLLVK